MLANSDSSFVFAYGEQSTKVLKAQAVLDAEKTGLTNLTTQSVSELFYDMFVCKAGGRHLAAKDNQTLQGMVQEMHWDAGVRITLADHKPVRKRKRPAAQ
jgi:hypothetical protein|tara:strand:- start:1378 stop:1677 length:300 start_codon:yes stop_codon:yes gene_type:complete